MVRATGIIIGKAYKQILRCAQDDSLAAVPIENGLAADLEHAAVLGEDAFMEAVAHRFELHRFQKNCLDGF